MAAPKLSHEIQCAGKATYFSKSEAKRAAVQSLNHGMGVMKAYKCPHCDRHHIGHTSEFTREAYRTQEQLDRELDTHYIDINEAIDAAKRRKRVLGLDEVHIYRVKTSGLYLIWDEILEADGVHGRVGRV